MPQKHSLPVIATGFLLGCFVLTRTAAGYIDPGTGSYVFQVAIAFVIGLAFSVKVFWKKVSTFFRKTFSPKKGKGPDAS